MSEQRTRDHIDLELSRTYFGSAVVKKEPPKAEKPKQEEAGGKKEQKTSLPARHSSPVLKFLFILWIVTVLIFAAGYFLRDNRIIFSLNINVEPRREAPGEAGTPVSEKLREFLDNAKTKIVSVVPAPAPLEPEKASMPQPAPVPSSTGPADALEMNVRTLYDFNNSRNGWEIPMWALDKTDHVARTLKRNENTERPGESNLEVGVEFPGGGWSAALVEVEQYLDFTGYDELRADIYIPPDCPGGLRCKLILTVGESWRFVEMSRGTRLKPGEWTTITASLAEDSTDWRRTVVDEAFKGDVRKIAVRVESNGKNIYSGPIYLDNIRLVQKAGTSTNISPSP